MAGWMIYGANGYTGRLAAGEAVRRGLQPVLAGRNRAAVEALAAELGLSARVVALNDARALADALVDMDLVLHCAGPFSATSAPMVAACLAGGTHYLDITGEIEVFRACHERDAAARSAGIAIIPGVGFDVVPTDCLAAMLAHRLPGAQGLQLAFEAAGGPSPGTAKTSIEGLAGGGRVCRNGRLETVPLAWKSMDIPFAGGPRCGVTIPWGDVYTAHISTGIPDVEVYLSVPPATVKRLRRMRLLRPLVALGPVKKWLKRRIERTTPGPDAETRAGSGCRVWGRVSADDGRTVEGEMHTPNGYALTVDASVSIAERLLTTPPAPGYHTPSQLLGAEYVLGLDGVSVRFGEVSSGNG